MKIKIEQELEEFTTLYMIKDLKGINHLMHPFGIMEGLGIL